jgi:hypothetical protein
MCGAAYDAVVGRKACTLSIRPRGGRAYNHLAKKGNLDPRPHANDLQSSHIADEIADNGLLLNEIRLVDTGEAIRRTSNRTALEYLARWVPTAGMNLSPAQVAPEKRPTNSIRTIPTLQKRLDLPAFVPNESIVCRL